MTDQENKYEWRASLGLLLEIKLDLPVSWEEKRIPEYVTSFRPGKSLKATSLCPQITISHNRTVSETMSLDEMKDLNMLSIKSNSKSFELLSSEKTKIGSHDAWIILAKMQMEDLSIKGKYAFMLSGKNFFILTYLAKEEAFDEYQTNAGSIIDSFSIKDKEVARLPENADNLATVNSTMKFVFSAILQNDISAIYNMLSDNFKKEWDFDGFKRRFLIFNEFKIDLSKIDSAGMTFINKPVVTGYNQLIANFYYPVDTGRLIFTLIYDLKDGQWEPANIIPAAQDIEKKDDSSTQIGFK